MYYFLMAFGCSYFLTVFPCYLFTRSIPPVFPWHPLGNAKGITGEFPKNRQGILSPSISLEIP